MNKTMKKRFTVISVRWFERVNGNTYHTVRITNNETGEEYKSGFTYGYGEQYRQTALWLLQINNHISSIESLETWERKNDYPILWVVFDSPTKRQMMDNVR